MNFLSNSSRFRTRSSLFQGRIRGRCRQKVLVFLKGSVWVGAATLRSCRATRCGNGRGEGGGRGRQCEQQEAPGEKPRIQTRCCPLGEHRNGVLDPGSASGDGHGPCFGALLRWDASFLRLRARKVVRKEGFDVCLRFEAKKLVMSTPCDCL